MNLIVTTKHTVSFSVEYFHNTEGGMDCGTFGDTVDNLSEAIEQLLLAKAADARFEKDRRHDWIIVCHVKTVTS